jgi:four helix bundle protein
MVENKTYDLDVRTFNFANNVRNFIRSLPKSIANVEDIKQLVRASGSVGANYIEANESLSKKDFIYRIKICRKESKESRFFLKLLDTGDDVKLEKERSILTQEALELTKIFGAIVNK